MKTFYALLAICAGNSSVTGEFLAQRPVTRSFDVFFDLRLNKQLSKESWGWRFETPSRSLWRHRMNTDNHDVRFMHPYIQWIPFKIGFYESLHQSQLPYIYHIFRKYWTQIQHIMEKVWLGNNIILIFPVTPS